VALFGANLEFAFNEANRIYGEEALELDYTFLLYKLSRNLATGLSLVAGYALLSHLAIRFFGVAAFDMSYAIGDLSADLTLGLIGTILVDAVCVKMQDALGTDPKKNWTRFRQVCRTNGISSDAQSFIFVLCHYSANPAVWEKIMKALVLDPALPNFTDASTYVKETRDFISKCSEWKKGGMPSTGKIMPQRILGCNPSYAAITWLFAMPNSKITVKEFLSQKWAVSMDIDAALKTEAEKYQTDFVTKTLSKTWDPKFITTAKKSNFYFPNVVVASGAVTSITREGTATFDRTALVAWINKMAGTALTV